MSDNTELKDVVLGFIEYQKSKEDADRQVLSTVLAAIAALGEKVIETVIAFEERDTERRAKQRAEEFAFEKEKFKMEFEFEKEKFKADK